MVPIYKTFSRNSDVITRDGFSLLIDQVKVEIDDKFYCNIPGKKKIRAKYLNASNVFEYEHKVSKKIKKNCNPECKQDDEFF